MNVMVKASKPFWVSLHSADPAEKDCLQSTDEVEYVSYKRVLAQFNFTDEGGRIVLAEDIFFPLCNGGRCLVTHWGIGTDETGPGLLYWTGELWPVMCVSSMVQPGLNAGTVVEEWEWFE